MNIKNMEFKIRINGPLQRSLLRSKTLFSSFIVCNFNNSIVIAAVLFVDAVATTSTDMSDQLL